MEAAEAHGRKTGLPAFSCRRGDQHDRPVAVRVLRLGAR
jgi:hypothetical protein